MPQPNIKPASEKLFVYLWIDHLGNRVYRATRNIGASPRRIQVRLLPTHLFTHSLTCPRQRASDLTSRDGRLGQ